MRWAGHVARMEDQMGVYRVLVGNLKETDHWGDPGADGRIILRLIFRKWDVGIWTGVGLPQDRDRWRTIVSAVMNLRVP